MIKEAHEAFKRAQDADPEYAPAWIGQVSFIIRGRTEVGEGKWGRTRTGKVHCLEEGQRKLLQ